MAKPVVIVGALDTKGEEFRFVRDLIAARKLETVVVDFGVMGDRRRCARIAWFWLIGMPPRHRF